MADLIPIVQRSYDLCAGLYEHVNRFPRAQRALLGRVILETAAAAGRLRCPSVRASVAS